MKFREVITYKEYFDDFFREQPQKVRDKIIKVLDIIEQVERIPTTYLKYMEGTNGLFEVVCNLGIIYFGFSAFLMAISLLFCLQVFRKRRRKLPQRKSNGL